MFFMNPNGLFAAQYGYQNPLGFVPSPNLLCYWAHIKHPLTHVGWGERFFEPQRFTYHPIYLSKPVGIRASPQPTVLC